MQPAAPVFEGVAKRKLGDLLARGYRIDGLAIRADEDTVVPRTRGFITTGGMVGWWTSEEEIRRIERNAAERALREQVREVPEGWRQLAERCLSAMRCAVHYGETGEGRPPQQTCLFEIQELEAMLSAAPTQPPAQEAPKKAAPEWFAKALFVSRLIDRVTRDVAELPDRNSPEDWPEAMLVTAAELADIIRAALPVESSDDAAPTQPAQPPEDLTRKCLPNGLRYKLPPLELTGHQVVQFADMVRAADSLDATWRLKELEPLSAYDKDGPCPGGVAVTTEGQPGYALLPTQPAQAERCPNCDGTGDVHSIDGQWRGSCHCPAGQKPAQAEQQDPEISLHMITDPVRRAAHEAYANHPDGQGHYVRMESVIDAVLAAQAEQPWSNERQAELNDWFLSLPEGRQKALIDDKWMLAGAAFLAGKASQVSQPKAAQQEPVYQYQLASGAWIDQAKDSYDYNVKHGQATVRVLYTAAAAPQREPMTKIGADRLAYAVAQLIQQRVIDTRSEAGDALLDYLDIGGPDGPKDVPSWMYQYGITKKK